MSEYDFKDGTKNINELADVIRLAREARVIYDQVKRDEQAELLAQLKSDGDGDDDGKFWTKNTRVGHAVSGRSMLEKLFPTQHQRLDKLTDIVRSWPSIVGPACGGKSAPYDLIGTKLYVASNSSVIRGQLFRMWGTIRDKIKERWGIECDKLFVTAGPAPVKPTVAHQTPHRQHAMVNVTEQDVAEKLDVLDQFAKDDPDSSCTLLEDNPGAARALAHLMAFFEKRFSKGR